MPLRQAIAERPLDKLIFEPNEEKEPSSHILLFERTKYTLSIWLNEKYDVIDFDNDILFLLAKKILDGELAESTGEREYKRLRAVDYLFRVLQRKEYDNPQFTKTFAKFKKAKDIAIDSLEDLYGKSKNIPFKSGFRYLFLHMAFQFKPSQDNLKLMAFENSVVAKERQLKASARRSPN